MGIEEFPKTWKFRTIPNQAAQIFGKSVSIDDNLQLVIETWPNPNDEAREQILSIVREFSD